MIDRFSSGTSANDSGKLASMLILDSRRVSRMVCFDHWTVVTVETSSQSIVASATARSGLSTDAHERSELARRG